MSKNRMTNKQKRTDGLVGSGALLGSFLSWFDKPFIRPSKIGPDAYLLEHLEWKVVKHGECKVDGKTLKLLQKSVEATLALKEEK